MQVKKNSRKRGSRYSQEDIERFADELILWQRDPTHIWFKDFCLEKDFHRNSLGKWARKNEKFKEVYEKAKAKQNSNLVMKILEKKFTKLKNLKGIKETCRMTFHGT